MISKNYSTMQGPVFQKPISLSYVYTLRLIVYDSYILTLIKMRVGAIIHCRFVKKKFQMLPAYACLLNDVRQKTNRARLIAACKRSFNPRLYVRV